MRFFKDVIHLFDNATAFPHTTLALWESDVVGATMALWTWAHRKGVAIEERRIAVGDLGRVLVTSVDMENGSSIQVSTRMGLAELTDEAT